jgi:hypothetical protein
MYHFATALFAGIVTTVLFSGIAFVPTTAGAAKMSNAERHEVHVALAEAPEIRPKLHHKVG